MASIQLEKSDSVLIQAAIKLGDWLLSWDRLTEADKKAIKAVQEALKKLPKINNGVLAMYGFSIERGDERQGLIRGWDVSLEYFANDPDQQGGLELFSSYIPIPESGDAAVLAKKKQNEVYFHWPVGDICSFIAPDLAERWIMEISDPNPFLQPGDRLRAEIVYQDFYTELEF